MDDAESPGSGQPQDNDDLTGEKISRMVDDIEQKVETERDEQGVPGSVSDREATEQVEPDDQAPE